MLLLPQTLTVREAGDALRMLAQGMKHDGDGPGVLDGSALQQFDSAALAVMIECHRLARVDGRGFAVQSLPPKLSSLATLYGVAQLLPSADVTPPVPATQST